MKASLTRRLEALEEGTGPIIDDLADYVRWCAEGCPSCWRWDPKFERQMEELIEELHDKDMNRK
jgi:hypothetical protein